MSSLAAKLCKSCGETKPLADFHPYKKNGGRVYHSTRCKPCHCKHGSEWQKKNKDKVRQNRLKRLEERRAAARETYHRNKHKYAEACKRRAREYRIKNRAACLAKMSQYGKRTRAARNQWQKQYRADHPEATRINNQRRRARQLRAFVEDVRPSDLIKRDGHRCHWCGADRLKLTIDHVTPLSRGGKHSMANCVLACKSCNSAKGSKLPLIFLADRHMEA